MFDIGICLKKNAAVWERYKGIQAVCVSGLLMWQYGFLQYNNRPIAMNSMILQVNEYSDKHILWRKRKPKYVPYSHDMQVCLFMSMKLCYQTSLSFFLSTDFPCAIISSFIPSATADCRYHDQRVSVGTKLIDDCIEREKMLSFSTLFFLTAIFRLVLDV